MGVCIALQAIAAMCAVAMYIILSRQNKQLERMHAVDDTRLTDKDRRKLEKTAEFEGISVDAARVQQKGFRYLI